MWAVSNGKEIERYPAEWNRYGRSAGYRRNEQMAKIADALIALWDGQSKGTQHMIRLARSYGLEVLVYNTIEQEFEQ